MDLNDILVFAKVVQAGSFVGASRALAIPKSTVSRKVAELEDRLGARLLQRTTRRLSLTEVGRTYYQHAQRVVGELENAERAVVRLQAMPQGLLRLTTPLNLGFFSEMMISFMRRYPDVDVELVATDRVVDLVEEGFDLGIRAGRLNDSSLIARHLGTFESMLVASPAFLQRCGTPGSPSELAKFDCVAFGAGSDRARWTLLRDGKTTVVQVSARLAVNDFGYLEEAAREGIGIAVLPLFRCVGDLRQRRLLRVLPDWCVRGSPLHAVYPSLRHLSPKVKALLDHLQEQMASPPWERGPAP